MAILAHSLPYYPTTSALEDCFGTQLTYYSLISGPKTSTCLLCNIGMIEKRWEKRSVLNTNMTMQRGLDFFTVQYGAKPTNRWFASGRGLIL